MDHGVQQEDGGHPAHTRDRPPLVPQAGSKLASNLVPPPPPPITAVQGEQVPLSELLITYCYERDVTCPHCSYSLRNSTTTRCPECGAELLLHIHPRLGGTPISSTVGLLGVVVGLILSIVAILGSFPRGWGAISVAAAMFVLTVVQLSLWDTYFRRIRRKDRGKLPVYIASGWAMPVIIILRWVLKI